MPPRNTRGLGRGLDALLRPSQGQERDSELSYLAIDSIEPNRYQPRRDFSAESLNELAESIRSNGILEPLLVRPLAVGYELVAGERRLRAAKLAGLQEVPAIVRFFDDRQTAEIALIENLQREDLNPIEEATAFRQLISEFDLTQEELAQRLGKSRSHLANTMRLLQLPPQIQDHLVQGDLEMGHARSLLSLPADKQLWLAEQVMEKRLTVRQTEAQARKLATGSETSPRAKPKTPSSRQRYWEGKLKQHLQTQVRIHSDGAAGRIEISFFDAEDLDRLMALVLGLEEER